MTGSSAPRLWREYGLALALYALLTVALTWPAIRDFSSELVSDGGDARNNLWLLWHVKETLAGRHHLFEMPLLYYPVGINLLARGLGPVVGLLALPFWLLGPEAAYNGSLLIGFWLSGVFMYLLARGLGFERRVAFFAGFLFLIAPVHLAGVQGHMTKTFLGLLPLSLLCLHHALDSRRSRWWAVAAAVSLFFTLFHNGYQFIFAGLAFAFFTLARLIMVERAERGQSLKRALFVAAVTVVLVGPFTLPFLRVAADPLVEVDATLESLHFQPDLIELFLPPEFSAVWGEQTGRILEANSIEASIESSVYLMWTVLLLCIVAWRRGPRRARPWLLFAALCTLVALGPSLQILGEQSFTRYELTVLMPYALLTELPGFDFMRAPGRFMMVGFVALAVGAAFGLTWLLQRYPQRAKLIFLAAVVAVVIEGWPRPWPQETLHPVPDFYRRIAQEEEVYGVFDLPVKPNEEAWFAGYSSYYQRYQMAHGKGIASGYLARTYATHPMFPCVIPEMREPYAGIYVNGEVADCAANLLYDLAHFNYRYVIFHKPDLAGSESLGMWGRAQARFFMHRYFSGQEPLVDDELVTVYAVPTAEEAARGLSPAIGLLNNWYSMEQESLSQRWARSPATLFLSAPRAQEVTLALTPGLMFEPEPENEQVIGRRGWMQVALNGEPLATVRLETGETSEVVLQIPAGVHTLSLALDAGNFRPVDYEMGDDERVLSFMMRAIELRTQP